MNDYLLTVDDVRVRYGRIPVVHGVSLNVSPGAVVGILGANGAGKTTTMRSIMGQRQMTGTITFDGEVISGKPAHIIARAGIAMVPEGRRVFSSLSVLNNLKTGSIPRRGGWRDEATLDDVVELFPELKPMLHRQAGILSGGQQQMLAVGRAMMSKPRLMILDEPSLGLAPLVVQRIYGAIRQLSQANMSILLAEQNAAMALSSVEYAYVMQTGLVVEQGDAAMLRTSSRVEEIYLGRSSDTAHSAVTNAVNQVKVVDQ